MTPATSEPRGGDGPGPNGSANRRLIDALGSLRFALIVGLLIIVACILGTVLPQQADVEAVLHQNPSWASWIGILSRLGLTNVYSAWWFIGLLGLLSASMAACTLKRIQAARKAQGRRRGNLVGSVLTHASLLLVLTGAIFRGVWGERGEIGFHAGESVDQFQSGNKMVHLPFSVHLVRFEIETYERAKTPTNHPGIVEQLRVEWPAVGLSKALPLELDAEYALAPGEGRTDSTNSFMLRIKRRVPDFVIGSDKQISSRSDRLDNPAILVEVSQPSTGLVDSRWLFARHPDFKMHAGNRKDIVLPFEMQYEVFGPPAERPNIKSFISTVQIREGTKVISEHVVKVNSPMSYGGYSFFQSGYNPDDRTWTSLLVVRDPGVPFVYTGFILLIVGLAFVFYIYPRNARPSSPGEKKESHDASI